MYVNDQEIKGIKAEAVRAFLDSETESSKKSMELAQELIPLLTRESVVITNRALRIVKEAVGRSISL